MAQKGKQLPWIIVIIAIFGILSSCFILVTQTNLIFKQDKFVKRIVLEPELDTDAGYIHLVRDERTPSTVDYARFENGLSYVFFSISENEIVEQKVYFDTPELEPGRYYVLYEVKFLSGKVENGEISFRVI